MSTINPHLDLEPTDALVEAFTDFYEQYYREIIEEYPDTPGRSVEVDYEHLQEYCEQRDFDDRDPLDKLVTEHPTETLHNAEVALQEFDDDIDGLEDASLRLVNHGPKTPIRQLRRTHMNKLVTVEGIVSKATDVLPKVSIGTYRCMLCGTRQDVEQPTWERETPFRCVNGDCETTAEKNFQLLTERSEIVNFQKIQVQESPEDLKGGQTPQSIDLTIHGDITGEVTPGERVVVTGILKARDTEDSSVLQPYMQGNNIAPEEQEFEELSITPEEERQIKELAQDPKVYEKLHQSLAPTIHGYETEKFAAVLQLFGGVRKTQPGGGTKTRGDLHLLYIGDPGTGKSQILRYVHKLSPRGVYTSGKGSSSAGLTAAAVKDSEFDDKWTLEAGAMVLADKGIAAVDELDKMRKEDRSAMHEALEQQTVSVSKAGINATLKSRCSLLGAANPSMGRWDDHQPIPSQIDIEPALVSRFDLIFTIKDRPDEDDDRELAEHILKSNRAGQRHAAGKEVSKDDEVVGEVPADLFRKYIAYARKNYRPELTDDAEKRIRDFYVEMRNKEGGDNDAIPVTARKLEGLVRLSEAAARIELSEEITEKHADIAVELTQESMRQVGIDPDTGEFDADILETGTTSSQRDRVTDIIEAVEALCDQDDDNLADKEDIVELASGRGHDPDRVRDTIERLAREGKQLYSPNADERYRTL